jgi:CheY-like chemotaxis protein
MRLLWVENHSTFARLAGWQFLSEHEVTVVPSLAAARAALAAGAFDAVLVDYDLDDGKGSELVPLVHGLPTPPAVVAVSSHEAGNAALVAAGAAAVCPKTWFAEIARVLRSVVGN